MTHDLQTLADGFVRAQDTSQHPAPIPHKELYRLFEDPANLVTHDVARSLAAPRGAPFGYAAAMTPDGQGFAVACYRDNRLSVMLKPDAGQPAAFWEQHRHTRQFTRDEAVGGYLASNSGLYGAVYQCIAHLQQDGDSQLLMAPADFAQDYRTMMDAREQKPGALKM